MLTGDETLNITEQTDVEKELQLTPFYVRLLELSDNLGYSLNQVEKDLGYPRNTLHNYRTKPVAAGVSRILELSKYFGVSAEYLLGVSKEKQDIDVESIFRKLSDKQKKEMVVLVLREVQGQFSR